MTSAGVEAAIPRYRAVKVIPHQRAGDVIWIERTAQPGVRAGRDPMAATGCGIQIAATLVTPAGSQVRCPACQAPAEILYGGAGGTAAGGGGTVWIMDATGLPCGKLPEVARPGYSPAGFTWGYEGAGCRSLAWSLLAHALGPAAVCSMCTGTGRITYPLGFEAGAPPVSPFDPARSPDEYDEAGIVVDLCWEEDCDSGYLIRPRIVQKFKRRFVAGWEGAWRISRAEILQWMAADQSRYARGKDHDDARS